jgi:hypothetical protein
VKVVDPTFTQHDTCTGTAVRAEHDGLLDVAGARRTRDHVDGARQRATLAPEQRERLFHARHDAIRAEDGDVGVRQQRGRRRRVRPCQHDQRAGLGDGAERAGDAEAIVARRRTRFDRESRSRPIEVGKLGPADARVRLLRRERGRQVSASM